MRLTNQQWAVALFTIGYIAFFAPRFIATANYEFLGYIGVLLFFFSLVLGTIQKTKFPLRILWGLSIWGFLHMAGGGLFIGGEALYVYEIFPVAGSGELFVLRYDQIVHTVGFFVATIAVHHLLKPYLREGVSRLAVAIALMAAGMGLGTLNEMIEFAAVLLIEDTGVGGYANTMLDIVFNTVGAGLAIVYLFYRERLLEFKGR